MMHRFPDQHFPNPVCCRLDTAHPLDSCGNLAAVKTYSAAAASTHDTDAAGGGGHDLVFRCQYGNKSLSGCVLRAKEPAIPFLKIKKKADKTGVDNGMHDSVPQVAQHTSSSFYGGNLSYAPVSSEECDGLLFYPSEPDLKELSVCPISLLSDKEHKRAPVYVGYSPVGKYPIEGSLLQIETVPSSDEGSIIAALRTDNQCLLVTVKLNLGEMTFTQTRTIKCEHKPTAIALSPYLKRECLVSEENGNIQLIDVDNIVQSIRPPGDDKDDTYQPCWSHYGSHPRLVLAHQPRRLDLLDVRIPSSDVASTCLMSLPNDYLARDQTIQVTRQHPVNYFYHFAATQDMLVLLDERFPKYHVLQWHHRLSSPPSCIDVVSQALPTDDLAVVSSFSTGQSHCFQLACLNGETPVSTSPLWKVSPISSWLEIMPEIPTCHDGLDNVTSRLQRSLTGMCTAQHSDGKGLAIFQASEMGDLFQHTFYTSPLVDADQHTCKTGIPGPGSKDVQLSEGSERICKIWMNAAMLEKRTKRKKVKTKSTLKRLSSDKLRAGFKEMPAPHPHCQICQSRSKTQDTTNLPKTPGRPETCPACGIQINTKLINYLKRTRLSQTIDGGIVTGKMAPTAKRLDDELPWKPLKYDQYGDAMSRLLRQHWQTNKKQDQKSAPSTQTPLAHTSSASPNVPQRLKAFLDSKHQLTQARLNTTNKSPQKKITARRKLLNPNFSMGF